MYKFILVALLLGMAGGRANAEESPLGDWSRGDGKAVVRVEPCGADLCATNTWVKPGTDGEDVGDRLVMAVSRNTASTFSGTATDAKRGLSYAMTLDVAGQQMTTRGCVLVVLCVDMGWTRVPADENYLAQSARERPDQSPSD